MMEVWRGRGRIVREDGRGIEEGTGNGYGERERGAIGERGKVGRKEVCTHICAESGEVFVTKFVLTAVQGGVVVHT